MKEQPPPPESSGIQFALEVIAKKVLQRSILLAVGFVVASLAALLGAAILFFGPAFFRSWGG
jgi:hypothetical protein